MILHIVDKLAPNSSHLTTGLVNYVPGRGCFRAVSSQNGDKIVTSPPPPPIVGRLLRGLQATHISTLNSMFARLGTDYKTRNELFFAILEALLLLFNIINLFYYVLKMFLFYFCLVSRYGD